MKYRFSADFHCPSCVMKVQQELDSSNLVKSTSIDLKSGVISVETEDDITREEVQKLIIKANPTIVFKDNVGPAIIVVKAVCYAVALIAFILSFIPFFAPAEIYLRIACYLLIAYQLVIDAVKCVVKKVFYDDTIIIFIISVVTMAFGELLDGIIIVAIWHASNLLIKIAMKNGSHHHVETSCESSMNFLKYAKIIVPAFIVSGIALILILKFAVGTDDFHSLILSVIVLSCPCPFIIGFTMLHLRTNRAIDKIDRDCCVPAYSDKKRAALDKELQHYHVDSASTENLGAKYKVAAKSRAINIENIVVICILKIVLIVLSALFDSVIIAVASDFVLIVLAVLNTLRIRPPAKSSITREHNVPRDSQ